MRPLLLALAAAGAVSTALPARAPDVVKPFVPVFEADFPDPFVLPHQSGFLAYATNATGHRANVQMAVSTDLLHWQPLRNADGKLHDALPALPAWARSGFTWAPEVMRIGGRYVLYFTARDASSDLQCIGAATGDDPRGPFVDSSAQPLVCQRDQGGSIDPSPFRDADGSLYLYFKSDGNNPRVLKPSRIFVQKLSADGLQLEGEATPLIANDQHWEWRVVESPAMVRNPAGQYALFFSANHFGWESDQRLSNYGIGYARCASATGPCTKAPENPVLHSYYTGQEGCLSGPGHETLLPIGDVQLLVFHAWSATNMCEPAGRGRFMYIAPLRWRGDTPAIGASIRP